MFDNLPVLKPTVAMELEDELVTYLSTKRDLDVVDALHCNTGGMNGNTSAPTYTGWRSTI